jgi:hypothetical protein
VKFFKYLLKLSPMAAVGIVTFVAVGSQVLVAFYVNS